MRIVSSYKDYYDYISQQYGFDPDIQPPEVSNDVKIMQHGFDLAKSFRHRK
jgi:hypothetical protein